jgi:hypothetical protein
VAKKRRRKSGAGAAAENLGSALNDEISALLWKGREARSFPQIGGSTPSNQIVESLQTVFSLELALTAAGAVLRRKSRLDTVDPIPPSR